MNKKEIMRNIIDKRKGVLQKLSDYDKGGDCVQNGDIIQHRSNEQNKQKNKS